MASCTGGGAKRYILDFIEQNKQHIKIIKRHLQLNENKTVKLCQNDASISIQFMQP
ncbi:unnamed protein product, partial [Callosobruchus maculatus]